MDAREFLLQVIPWSLQGYATIHWKHQPAGSFLGRSFTSIDDMLATVARLSKKPKIDIWFGLSKQSLNSGKRDRAHAQGFKAVFADVDVEPGNPKKCQTLDEAVMSVLQFCIDIGIPPPSYMVKSGGGLHCYWLSKKVLSVDEWQPYADAFKATALKYGLKIDPAVTADAARVLRVPGTWNWKLEQQRPVQIIPKCSTTKQHDFAVIFAHLDPTPVTKSRQTKKYQIPKAFAHLDPNDKSLSGGIDPPPLLKIEDITPGCGWLREAYETGGKTYQQPQWHLVGLACTFMVGGHELLHKLSDQYPTYTFQKAEDLWFRKLRDRAEKNIRWPSCKAIQASGSTHCKTCIYLPLKKSPLHLGLKPPEETLEPEALEPEEPEPEVPEPEIARLGGVRDDELPPGYVRNQDGYLSAAIPQQIKDGKVLPARILQMLTTKVWGFTLQHQDGAFGVGFTSKTDKFGTHDVFVSSANCQDPGLFTHLASKAVMINMKRKKEAKIYMERFMNSLFHKLTNALTAVRDPGSLGWRYEEGVRVGFAYGNALHLTNGTTAQLGNSTDDDFSKWYLPVGKKEVWLRACKLLTDRQQPELDIIIAVAFAAPLVPFIGNVYGAILSIWGEPGTAKSTAQQVAAAVWGHPKQTRESLTSTPKSVQGRLGRIKNLPAYWDDIQDEKHQDYLSQTMFVATEGTEGGRLNPDASYKERKDWQTMLIACSNASFVEYLLKKQKSTTAGLRRVLEFEFNKYPNDTGIINAVEANRTFAELEHNYGVVGLEYAQLLAREHKEVADLVKRTTDRFSEKVRGESDETFWWGICGVLLAGATLAKRIGVELDVTRMANFLINVLLTNRATRNKEGTEGGSLRNTELSLSAFMNKFVSEQNVLFVSKMFEHHTIQMEVLKKNESNMPKQILIQVARDQRRIFISKRALREFLQKEGIHTRQVLDGLEKYYKAKETKISLGAGTALVQTQELCIELPVPVGHPLLEGVLTACGRPAGEPEDHGADVVMQAQSGS
jgi:hypothetical protein